MINCRSVAKTKLPIAAAVKIGLRGNWVLRILTIVLLSVAFAALTMITTFYTGNYKSAYVSSIENSLYYYTIFRVYAVLPVVEKIFYLYFDGCSESIFQRMERADNRCADDRHAVACDGGTVAQGGKAYDREPAFRPDGTQSDGQTKPQSEK